MNNKHRLSFTVASTFLALAPAALAGDLAVTGDTVNFTAAGFADSPTIGSNGILTDVTGIPTGAITSDLGLSFTMQSTGTGDGIYSFEVGMFIDHDDSQRRLEIFIPGVTMTFSNSGSTLVGAITGNSVTVHGRSADGATTLSTTTTNSAFDFNGSSLSVSAGNQLNDIQTAGDILGDLVATFNTESQGHYNYGIFLAQTGGPEALTFGTAAGSAFPCAPASPFEINTAKNATLSGSSALQGEIAISGASDTNSVSPTAYSGTCTPTVTSSGGGGGGGNDSPTEEEVEEQQQAVEDTLNELAGTDLTDPNNVTDDVVDTINMLLEDTGTLGADTSAGIEGGNVDTDVALDVIDTLTDALDLAGSASQGGGDIDTAGISDSLDGISDIFTALDDAGGDLTTTEITQVQTLTEESLTSITNVFTDSTGADEAESLVNSVSNVVNSALDVGATLDTDLLSSVESLTQTALQNTLDDIASALDSSLDVTFEDVSTTQTLLSSNTQLLSAVLDTISIEIGSTIELDQTSTASTLESSGLDSTDAAALASNLAQFQNPTGVSIPDSGGTITAADAIDATLGGGTTIEVDSTTGLVDISISDTSFPVNVAEVTLVPESIPEGLTVLPDGSALSVSDGIASTVVPAPKDPVSFASALSGIGTDVSFDDDGSVAITDDSGLNFSGTFAFDGISGGDDSSSGDVTFTAPEGDPADPSYTFKVNYPDGTSQNILPFVSEDNFFDSLSSRSFNFNTNRSTGVVSVGDSGFKPDYFVSPLSSTDQSFLNANQDSTGVAYRAVDRNGDGVTDYEVISASGVQVVYGVP